MHEPLYPSSIRRRTRGYLPHWERDQGTYFVTFRLADSLPASVLAEVRAHKKLLEEAKRSRNLLPIESVLDNRLSARKLEGLLDAGAGECILNRPDIATIVADSVRFGEPEHYELLAWCVMPNHAHVLLYPRSDLAKIVASWKSFTSRKINMALGRRGVVWQREYFDRLIRDGDELKRAAEYIRDNPIRAGLRDWPWVYVRQR